MKAETTSLFQILFVVTVACIYTFLLIRIRKIWPAKTQIVGTLLAIWLGILIALSFTAFIKDFALKPPPVLFVIMPPLLIVLMIAFNLDTGKKLQQITPFIPVLIQGFRIIIEFILWGFYKNGTIPIQMTFEGLNYDILIGLTAIPIAILMINNKISRKQVIVWNVLGMIVLTNIVLIALLSAPTSLRYFMNEPANRIILDFPFIWLPGFIVPFAYLMHIISIRQMMFYAKK